MAWYSRFIGNAASNTAASGTVGGGIKQAIGRILGYGGAAGAAVGVNSLTDGGFFSWIKNPIQDTIETLTKPREGAKRETELYSFGALLNVLGKAIAEFFGGRGPVSDWIRSKGQGLMGIPPEQRLYGEASDPDQSAASVSPNATPSDPDSSQHASAGIDPTITASVVPDASSAGISAANAATGLAAAGLTGLGARSALSHMGFTGGPLKTSKPLGVEPDEITKVLREANGIGDDIAEATVKAEKGWMSKMFRGATSFKGNAYITGALALGTGAVTLLSTGSVAQSAEASAENLGYDETVDAVKAGNYEEAAHTATTATLSLTGGFAGAAMGATYGATAGTAVLPFGGTLVGGLVGGVAGGFAGSGLGSVVGEAAYSVGSWAVGGISSLFNSAASDTAPAKPQPAPAFSFTNNEPQWAAPIM